MREDRPFGSRVSRWLNNIDTGYLSSGSRTMNFIDEVEQIERIERLERRYASEFGQPPFNVSHWDPSEDFARKLLPSLVFDTRGDALNYIYSYTTDLHVPVLRKLGFDPEKKRCLFTPSGTASMLCAVNWLHLSGVRLLTGWGPLYFPMLYQSRLCGLSTEVRYLARKDGQYQAPTTPAERREAAGLWVTNPAYCAGVRLSEGAVECIRSMLADGCKVVADESLVTAGGEIGPELADAQDFVAIYAPHKGISVNGLKFSVVIFDREHEALFDQWADVLYGPLNLGCIAAVKHYLSENFTAYDATFRGEIAKALSFVRRACLPNGPELDLDPTGHFISIYCSWLDAQRGEDVAFLWDLTRETGTSVLPGTRNYFDPSFGFCFRINLARDGAQFRAGIERLCRFLARTKP